MLTLEPARATVRGYAFSFTRPTLLDLVEAIDASAQGVAHGRAWALHRHTRDAEGVAVFSSIDAAMQCPAALAAGLSNEIERLYNEGRD